MISQSVITANILDELMRLLAELNGKYNGHSNRRNLDSNNVHHLRNMVHGHVETDANQGGTGQQETP